MAEMREELGLALSQVQLEKQGTATLNDVTQDWADNNKLYEYDTVIEEITSEEERNAIMKKDGITGKFVIDNQLNIIEAERITGNEQYQTITLNLAEGVSIDNKIKKIAFNKQYKATINVDSEHILETLTVTMGGEPVAVDLATRDIKIENVTGDIEITATARKLDFKISDIIIGAGTNSTSSKEHTMIMCLQKK